MKISRLLTATALLAAVSAQAQEVSDTLVVVSRPANVTVTESASGNSIVIMGQDDDPDFFYSYTTEIRDTAATDTPDPDSEWGLSLPFLKEKTFKRSNVIWFNQVYLGIVMPADGPRGIDPSVETGVGQLVGFSYRFSRRGPSIAFGAGIHYQQYTLHDRQIFGMTGRALSIVPLDEGMTSPSSRLRNFGFQFPLTVTQKITGDFGITVGAVLKLNTFTKATSTFESADTSFKRDFKGLNQRALGVDLYGAIGFTEDFGLYLRYTPTSLFQHGYGPDLTSISFGITIGM